MQAETKVARDEPLAVHCLNDIENLPANNRSTEPLLETSNPIEFDISIISNHSSIISDINPKCPPKKLTKSATTTNSSLFKFDSGLTKSNFDDFDMHSDHDFVQDVVSVEHRTDENMNSTKGDDMDKTDLTMSYVNVLVQGQYDTSATTVDVQECSGEVRVDECNDNNVAEVRSQFMQR